MSISGDRINSVDYPENPTEVGEIIRHVYASLKAKGHDPVMQMVGYIISGDPTYVTSYNNARSLIRRVERDELIEELVSHYLASIEEENR